MINSLAIIGTNRLAEELLALSQEKGVEATLLSDAAELAKTINCVIDTESGAEENKRALLQRLDATLPPAAVIISSCLRFATTGLASWVKHPQRRERRRQAKP